MKKIKIQTRKAKAEGKTYNQFWVTLPKRIVNELELNEGQELNAFVDCGDIILRIESNLKD